LALAISCAKSNSASAFACAISISLAFSSRVPVNDDKKFSFAPYVASSADHRPLSMVSRAAFVLLSANCLDCSYWSLSLLSLVETDLLPRCFHCVVRWFHRSSHGFNCDVAVLFRESIFGFFVAPIFINRKFRHDFRLPPLKQEQIGCAKGCKTWPPGDIRFCKGRCLVERKRIPGRIHQIKSVDCSIAIIRPSHFVGETIECRDYVSLIDHEK
jgi:hypothetical protein